MREGARGDGGTPPPDAGLQPARGGVSRYDVLPQADG
jgi:hypothetical protein